MSQCKKIDYSAVRKSVSKLFYAVLTKQVNVRDALANFPKDCEDETIIASWHALCHYEADEDIRKRDKEYKDIQDEYIEFIANTLSKGESIPDNIIKEYKPFHEDALIPPTNTQKGVFHQLKKFLCCDNN